MQLSKESLLQLRITGDFRSRRHDEVASDRLPGENDRSQLSVVGLTSPIFAKAGSISCRAVHENGNRLPIDIGLQKAERNGFKGKRNALQNREW